MLRISKDTKLFVLCPSGVRSGGPEAIHQLVGALRDTIDAYVLYGYQYGNSCIVKEYEKYNCRFKLYLDDYYDDSNNLIVVPETWIDYLYTIKRMQTMIWWLSVDNFERYSKRFEAIDKSFKSNLFHNSNIMHLVQSQYADDYLREKGVHNIEHLSDYISEEYFIHEGKQRNRRDVVLYNPKKGIEVTKRIMKKCRDVSFYPIENLSTEQVINLMDESKVYIDFGNHPGKDRIPRQAALRGLCVITSREGSAANDVDVSIPEKYKIIESENMIDEAVGLIRNCLFEYEKNVVNFEKYKRHIGMEKENFLNEAERLFKYD